MVLTWNTAETAEAAVYSAGAETRAVVDPNGQSSFTVTWTSNQSDDVASLTVELWNTITDSPISVSGVTNLSYQDPSTFSWGQDSSHTDSPNLTATTLQDITIDGYSIPTITYSINNGEWQSNFTSIRAEREAVYAYNYWWNWYFNGSNSDSLHVSEYPVTIRLNYTPDFYITDEIMQNGSLVPTFREEIPSSNVEHVDHYVWEKCETQNGDYTSIERRNTVGTSYNMEPDGTKLYPALDDGARQWYRVSACDAEGNVLYTSAPYQVLYFDSLQNGGFETPNNLNDGFNRIENRNGELTAEDEFIWRTTATDGNIEVVRASSTSQDEYGVSEDGESAEGTEQFAELNADSPGALYQDVLTAPGTTLYWGLMHRARNTANGYKDYNIFTGQWFGRQEVQNYIGSDTMYVIIMSANTAAQSYTAQTDINNLVSEYATYLNSDNYYLDEEKALPFGKSPMGRNGQRTLMTTLYRLTSM